MFKVSKIVILSLSLISSTSFACPPGSESDSAYDGDQSDVDGLRPDTEQHRQQKPAPLPAKIENLLDRGDEPRDNEAPADLLPQEDSHFQEQMESL